jgi:hypothetical protein
MKARLRPGQSVLVRALVACAALALAACATPSGPTGDRSLLAFLQDGSTTRAEVALRLGEPSAQLESDRLLCYRIGGDAENGYTIVLPRHVSSIADEGSVKYSLVLDFDENGVLQRHALVPVR